MSDGKKACADEAREAAWDAKIKKVAALTPGRLAVFFEALELDLEILLKDENIPYRHYYRLQCLQRELNNLGVK